MSTKKNQKPKDHVQISAWLPSHFHAKFKAFVSKVQEKTKKETEGAHVPPEREIIQKALLEYMNNHQDFSAKIK